MAEPTANFCPMECCSMCPNYTGGCVHVQATLVSISSSANALNFSCLTRRGSTPILEKTPHNLDAPLSPIHFIKLDGSIRFGRKKESISSALTPGPNTYDFSCVRGMDLSRGSGNLDGSRIKNYSVRCNSQLTGTGYPQSRHPFFSFVGILMDVW